MAKKLQIRGDKILFRGRKYRTFQGQKTWKRGRDSRPLADRLWEKVDIRRGQGPNGDCWCWNGALVGNGYGEIAFEGRPRRATHAMYFLLRDKWPKNCLLHRCDNPGCVRPSHLFLGTNDDNVRDRDRKGRWAKLTERQIPLLRSYYRKFGRNGTMEPGLTTLKEIAAIIGVSKTQVQRIVSGKTWKHVR